MVLEGVGETTASMLYATLGNGTQFTNGRQASAFVVLTPKQYSSDGKVMMLGIDKFGGVNLPPFNAIPWCHGIYLPTARLAKNQKQARLIKIVDRVDFKRACIALANKTMRTAWTMLHYETEYQPKPLLFSYMN
ncbi:hypothetical protein VspSTUT11_12670 [Vibrio sp. STUT-A11]|uniref:IS110 family transposase n=1 Tax=Vibrio TaxID=662 RepID=UPI000243C200|nr:IS110 family transposase [Vibrio natriegens]AEX22376.1 transposase IS116/IS110/IS902 family protein [Vibrio sp. EJY3]BDR13291.1 hypothetical protein VspSTUT11_12670 [Vibrio sp. STUT-A11]